MAGALTVLMAGSVEIAVPIVVLSAMRRAGAPIMKADGKSRFEDERSKMKRLSILLLVVMVSLNSYATNEEKEKAKESQSASFQPKPLDDGWFKWLVGEWEGTVESDVGTGRVRTKIEFGLNGQFLVMKSEAEIAEITDKQRQYLKETLHASDEYIEKSQNSIFEELQIHTIDPTTGEIVGYLFDGLRCTAEGRARRQGNKEIVEWKWSGSGATSVCVIEKISDTKIILGHKYTLPDGNRMEAKTEITRKRGIVKDSSSHLFYLEPLEDEWSKWLIGKWEITGGGSEFLGDELEGVGESSAEVGAGYTIEFRLNRQFVIWESWAETGGMTDEQKKQVKEALGKYVSDEELERFVSMPYRSLLIQTVDPKTGERIAYCFDSQRLYGQGKGRLEGNREIMEWEWSGIGRELTSVSIMEKGDENRLTISMTYTLPGGNRMEEKMELIRKKIKTEK